MANWIYFALIAQFIWSFTSLIDKIVISKGYIKSPFVYIVLNGLMNVLLIFLIPFFSFEPLIFTDFLIVMFTGIMFSAAVIIYYKAVQYDEISRITMMYQFGPIFVLILSFLFLGDALTKNHFIGFLFLLIAGLIVSYKKTNGSFKLTKAFWYMLLASLLGSISLVLAKHIFSVTSFWNAFLWLRLSGFSALVVLAVPSIRSQFINTFKNMKNKIKGLLGFKMVIDFSAFIFSGYALMNAPAPIVSALNNSVLPLFVFIIALLTSIYLPKLVKEDINKKVILIKIAAIMLIIIGIVFINM